MSTTGKHMQSKPTVSLCMIVKNEEIHLPDCLESIRRLVDEVVVVDTGSSDRTVEIARSFGADVYSFPWINDFSAARNESLRYATCDWVFWMDADERLNCSEMADCLREAASAPGIDAYLIPIRSHRLDNTFGFHYAIRFFKRYPDIAFEGEVHESVTPFLQKVGANFVPSPFFIDHLGYAIDTSDMHEKLERNIALLHKTLERNPKSAFALYYMGMSLLVSNRTEESLDALHKALEGEGLTANLEALTLNAIAAQHYLRRDYSETLKLAQKSLEVIPNQNTACLFSGLAHYYLEQYRSALPYLFKVYQFSRLSPEKRRTGISKEESCDEAHILKAIAVCYTKLQQYPQAIALLHRHVGQNPQDAEAFYLLGVCSLNSEDHPSAIRYLTQSEMLGHGPARLSFPLAYAHFKMGDLDESKRYFLAMDADEFNREGIHLLNEMVTQHFSKGLNEEIAEFLDQLAMRIPHHQKILDALGIALIKLGRLETAIDVHHRILELHPSDDQVSRRLAALFVKTGDYEQARRYLTNPVGMHDR